MQNETPSRILLVLVPLWLVFAYVSFVGGSDISDGYSKGGDLYALYMAAYALSQGLPELAYAAPQNFFTGSMPDGWVQLMVDLGVSDGFAFPYLYPPLWIELATPLTGHISMATFGQTVLIAHIVMLGVMPWMAARLCDLRDGRALRIWYVLAFCFLIGSTPFQSALFFNQLQTTTAFLVLAGLLAYRRDSAILAGILIGLAAALKISPALFGLIFLLDRNWRASLACAVTGVGLLAASVALAGVDLHLQMLTRLAEVSAITPVSHSNWSLESVLFEMNRLRTGQPMPNILNEVFPVLDAAGWVQAAPKLVMVAGVALIALLSWRAAIKPAIAPRALTIALLLALMGPLGWSHYFTLPILLLPVFLRAGPSPLHWIGLLLLWVLCSMPLFQILLTYNGEIQATVLPPALAMLVVLLLSLGQLALLRKS